MSNEIIKKEEKQITYQVAGEDVKLSEGIVKQFLTRGNVSITQQEAVNFIQLCKYRKLNPFLNEAYLVKFGNDPAQLIVGFDAFKRKADENPNYKGYRAGVIVCRGKEVLELEGSFKLPTDTLVGGWCEVYVNGKEYPVVAKVSFAEYNKGKSLWAKLPATMIRKVAISQALREAFPGEIGALYTQEELGVDEGTISKHNTMQSVVEEVKEEINNKANQEVLDFENDEKPVEVIEAEIVDMKESTANEDEEPDF